MAVVICSRCEHHFDLESIPAHWASCPNCGFYEAEWERPVGASPDRQGWRAERLAHVERLLTELNEELVIREQRDMGEPPDYLGERVLEALAEVRLLNGKESP